MLSRVAKLFRSLDLPVVLLFAAILVFRIAWVLLVSPHPMVKDAANYDKIAHWYMESGTFVLNDSLNPSAWVMPGYSFFLSIVYWLFGSDPSNLAAVRILHVFLSVLTIVVIYRIALRVQGRRLGIVSAVLAGLYPPFILANEYVLTEVLYTFLLCLVVLFGIRLLQEASWTNAYSFGLLLALSAYVRPAGLVWGVMPFLLLLKKVRFRRILALAGVAVVIFCLCMTPWWVRSERIYNRFVPFTTSDGFTMVRGTYEMFGDRQYDEQIEGMELKEELRTPEQELEANAHWQEVAETRVRNQLREEPATLIWGRIQAIARSFATPTYPSFSSLAETRPSLSKLAVRGLQAAQLVFVLIPAAAGVWLGRRDRKTLLLATLPVIVGLAYAAILILPRYVFPVMPVMLLLAAVGWLKLFDWVRSKRAARAARQQESPAAL